MKRSKPSYYDDFRCLAGACPDSCCHQWSVQVDADSAARYLTLPGPLGDSLRKHLAADPEGDYTLTLTRDRRCPMWQRDGLCAIQCTLGEDALCQVCRTFPRLTHDYGDFVELGLELSCPEAARLILTQPLSRREEEITGDAEVDYDREAMDILRRTRQQALEILFDPRYPVQDALTLLLLYGFRVQEELDGGESAVFTPEADLSLAGQLAGTGDWAALTAFFRDLEILTPQWQQRLDAPCPPRRWPESLRALGGYFIDRYWLQAVSDYDLMGRVKLTVAACLLISHLGENLNRTAQLFSKEIENDPDNVDAILDGAYTSPALTDRNLLSLLRSPHP